jgi:hypothetical protein
VTSNFHPLTRTGKKRGTATLTAPNQTAGPLGVKTLALNKFLFIKIYLDFKFSFTYQDFAT